MQTTGDHYEILLRLWDYFIIVTLPLLTVGLEWMEIYFQSVSTDFERARGATVEHAI
jgi:hypothetical protein